MANKSIDDKEIEHSILKLTQSVVELLAHFVVVGMVYVEPQRSPGSFTLLQVRVIIYFEFILNNKLLE